MNANAQEDVSTAKWMKQPVMVDGENTDWSSLNFYDDQTQLNFGIANDSNNIYLCFQTTTDAAQRKLMFAGMKVTLSTKGKNRHEATIVFPEPQPKQEHAADTSAGGSNTYTHPVFNKEGFRQNYIAHHTTMQVSGFADVNGDISIKNPSIQAAVNWDSASNFICEFAISKKEFFGTEYIAKQALENITLGVEINGLPKSEAGGKSRNPVYKGGGMNDEGMHGGGMHGMRTNGGGFNGGGRPLHDEANPMNNENKVSLSSKASFKQKFVLNNGNE